jgi:hypothetical protein
MLILTITREYFSESCASEAFKLDSVEVFETFRNLLNDKTEGVSLCNNIGVFFHHSAGLLTFSCGGERGISLVDLVCDVLRKLNHKLISQEHMCLVKKPVVGNLPIGVE